MRVQWAHLSLLIVCLPCLGQPAPQLSQQALTADQQAIYRAFLASYSNGSGSIVNLSSQTTAFHPDDTDLKGCLAGMDLSPAESSMIHSVPSDLLPARGFRLVDPARQLKEVKRNDPGTLIQQGDSVDDAVKRGFASGLLNLSEIIFSSNHRYAAFQYSFYCGRLCGNGALLIYENVNGTWKEAKDKHCSFWES